MDDVAVEAAAEPDGTPPAGGAADESGTPPVDAQAAAEGGEPAGGETVDELLRFARSRGHQDLDDKARNDVGSFLGRTLTQNKTLSEELAQLKAQLAQRDTPARPAEPEPEPEPHPDLKTIDEYIGNLKAERDALPEAEKTLVKDLISIDREIIRQKAFIERADDLDKPALNAELARLNAERGLLSRQLKLLPTDRARVEAEIRRAERDRRTASESLEAEEAARQEAGEATQQRQQEFLTTVDTLIPQIAKEVIPTLDPTLAPSMAEAVNDRLTIALFRLEQAGIKQFDIQKIIRDQVEWWAKDRQLVSAARLKSTSVEKNAVARPGTPAPRTPQPPNPATQALSAHERWERKKAALNNKFGW